MSRYEIMTFRVRGCSNFCCKHKYPCVAYAGGSIHVKKGFIPKITYEECDYSGQVKGVLVACDSYEVEATNKHSVVVRKK